MNTFWLMLATSLAMGAGEIETPAAGFARAADGVIVRVSGIAGSFVTTATEQSGAISSGFSAQLGFVKTATSMRVLDKSGALASESDAPPGAALFGFDATGRAGAAYFVETHTVQTLVSGIWRTVPFQPAREVLAVSVKDEAHVVAIFGGDRLSVVSIRTSDGAIETETVIGSGGGPAMFPGGGGVLYRREDGLVYRDDRGAEHSVPSIAEPSLLMHMSDAWVQVQTESGLNLAVRLEPEICVYEIPEVPQ